MSDTVHEGEVLQDLLDRRLPPDEEARVRQHLLSCERCRGELALLERGRSAAASVRGDRDLPAGFASQLAAALDAEDRPPGASLVHAGASRTGWLPGRRWAVAGAAAAVLVGAVLWWTRPEPTATALAARDFRSVVAGQTTLDLVSTDPAALERYFANGDGPRVRVLDLAMMGFVLEGGRRNTVADRISALYVYRNASGDRIVCQMYEGTDADLPGTDDVRDSGGFRFHVVRENDVTLVFWREGNVICVLASRIPREDVVRLAFAKAMRPA